MPEIIIRPNEKYSRVGGWLLLLCIVLCFSTPLSSVYNFYTGFVESQPYFDTFPGILNLVIMDGILSFIVIFMSIRAGIALWFIKPNAVYIAKNYFWIFLGYSIIAVFLPFTAGLPVESYEAMIMESVKNLFQNIFYFGVWYSYLNLSSRVAQTYAPKRTDNMNAEIEEVEQNPEI